MNTTDIQASVSSLIESRLASDWRHAPNSYVPPPAFDGLVRAGDDAVEAVTKAIMGAIEQAARGGEDRLPTMFAIRDLMTVLARIDTPRSRSELVAFLNRSYPEDQEKPRPGETPYPYWYGVQDCAIAALGQCGQCHDPEAVEGLRAAAANGLAYREQFGKVYLLARKFGGRIPLSVEQGVTFVRNLPDTEEAIAAADEFADVLPTWPGGKRCVFYWYQGNRVERVRGKSASLPYYAASVLANPAREAAAWSKFPGVEPTPEKAAELARAYPLPGSALPTTSVPLPGSALPTTSVARSRRWWHRRST